MTKVLLLYLSICKLTLGNPIHYRTHAQENEMLEESHLILSTKHDSKPNREFKQVSTDNINFEKLSLGHKFVLKSAMKPPSSSLKVTSILSPSVFKNKVSIRTIRRNKRTVGVLRLPDVKRPPLKQLTETVRETKPPKTGKVFY